MTNEPLSDNAIIALTRKKVRQRKAGLLLCILLISPFAGLAGWKIAAWRLGHHPISLPAILMFGAAIFIFLPLGMAVVYYFTRPPRGAYSAHILVKRADELQWQVRRYLLVMALISLPLLAIAPEIALIQGAGHRLSPPGYVQIAIFFLLAALTLFFLIPNGFGRAMRPVFDDELSKAMRLRALAWGFWATVPGLAALFALSLYNRNLAVEMMIPVLYLAVAVPVLRYCYLDWRSSRDG